jgi:dynein light intermediate chain
MIPPLSSLVKYDNPVLVSTSKDKGKGKTLTKKGPLPPVEVRVLPALLLLFSHV